MAIKTNYPVGSPEWVREGIADFIEENWGHIELWTPEIAERIRLIEIRVPPFIAPTPAPTPAPVIWMPTPAPTQPK